MHRADRAARHRRSLVGALAAVTLWTVVGSSALADGLPSGLAGVVPNQPGASPSAAFALESPEGSSSSAPGAVVAHLTGATAHVDGVSDQNLQSWDSYFSGFFHRSWAGGPARHVKISRYAVQWNVMSGAYPNYLAKYEAWYAASAALRLTPELAVTSYDGVVPHSSTEYRSEIEKLLNLKAVRYLEPWNEPNNSPAIPATTAAQFANAAHAMCESRCVVIVGDFLDSPNMVGYEKNYEQALELPSPRNWGIHPYYAIKAENESTVVNFRANLPSSSDTVWFTEVGAYQCIHEVSRGELQQARDASWLVNHLMPTIAPAHVLYYEYLDGNPPPCSGSNADTALYLPGADPNAPDSPRPAANYVFAGRGVPSTYTGPATGVAAASATLTASVYPGGFFDTRYHFEYGPTKEYGSYSAEGDAGSGAGGVQANIAVAGLNPGATYHYRLVAWNAEGSSDEGPSAGTDRVLHTSRASSVLRAATPRSQQTDATHRARP